MKPTKVLSLLLCILMLCTLVLGGCNKKEDISNSSTADETSSVTTTLNETEVPSSAEPITEPVASTKAEVKETTKTKETSPSDKSDNSDNNSNAGPVVNSQEQKPMTCTVTVANKDYTYKLGEKFTYTCYLKTPDIIEDIQAQVLYSCNQLKLVSKKTDPIFPILDDYAVYNLNNAGIIKYNATNFSGIEFDTEGVLITLTFEIIYGGSASVTSSIEVMTGIDGTLYADNFKLHEKVKMRETIG